ncbi:gliding motility-associated C-terminal domain-containing protein, partial [Flavobacteriaceae bacterium F89]
DTVTYTPDTGYNGTDTFEYTVCDNAGTCDTAMVTITVGTMSIIDAVDDDYRSKPINGTAGGVVNGSNVYSNDTSNGEPLNPNDVILTSTPTGPLTVNTDGTVTVDPNTRIGTYTIEYTICEKSNPDNCDTATVTVEVDDDILINQMVTPNGDGKNDFLFIRGVRNFPNNSIKIFNRWGVLVYEGSGYNNQNNVFDGHSKGRSTLNVEKSLPASVYYYIFNYEKNMQNITLNGYIYVSK